MVKLNVLALLTLAAAATPALSTIVITSPVASTTGHGEKKLTVEWNDDGKDPKLSSDWGSLNVYLATGSRDVQYKLQTLGSNVPNTQTRGRYKIDQNVGPDGGYYFIRIEGTKTDAKGIPPMAFSARFTLEGMKGQFNSTIKAELSGAGGTASPGGGASPTAAGVSTLRITSSTSTSLTRPTTSNTPIGSLGNKTSGAASVGVAGFATALVTIAAIGATFF